MVTCNNESLTLIPARYREILAWSELQQSILEPIRVWVSNTNLPQKQVEIKNAATTLVDSLEGSIKQFIEKGNVGEFTENLRIQIAETQNSPLNTPPHWRDGVLGALKHFANATIRLFSPQSTGYFKSAQQKILDSTTQQIAQCLCKNMLTHDRYDAMLKLAAREGELSVFQVLENVTPKTFSRAILVSNSHLFRQVAENNHRNVLSYLEKKVPKKFKQSAATAAFQAAVRCNQHQAALYFFNYHQAFFSASSNSKYRTPIQAFINEKIQELREKQAESEGGSAAVFDVSTLNEAKFCLRMWKTLSANPWLHRANEYTHFLQEIPSVKELIAFEEKKNERLNNRLPQHTQRRHSDGFFSHQARQDQNEYQDVDDEKTPEP